MYKCFTHHTANVHAFFTRWETKDLASLTEKEKDLMEQLKEMIQCADKASLRH